MIDQGNMCLECRQDTSFGTGKYVNRTPLFREDEEGYMCESCENETKLDCYKICLNCTGQTCKDDSRCAFCGHDQFREITKGDL